jgi:hypothetical protein
MGGMRRTVEYLYNNVLQLIPEPPMPGLVKELDKQT